MFLVREHMSVPVAPGMAGTVLGKRSWKDVDLTKSGRLENLLEMKEEEIASLRQKLTRITASSRRAESNMASQESLIKSLQARHESERSQKHHALYELAERSQMLDECSRQQATMEESLGACRESLVDLVS